MVLDRRRHGDEVGVELLRLLDQDVAPPLLRVVRDRLDVRMNDGEMRNLALASRVESHLPTTVGVWSALVGREAQNGVLVAYEPRHVGILDLSRARDADHDLETGHTDSYAVRRPTCLSAFTISPIVYAVLPVLPLKFTFAKLAFVAPLPALTPADSPVPAGCTTGVTP